MHYLLDYHQKDKKYNTIDVKRISNEPILDQPYPSPVTPSKDANQIDLRKRRTFAKEEDIKTMMDILPIDSDVNNLLFTRTTNTRQIYCNINVQICCFKTFIIVYFVGQ